MASRDGHHGKQLNMMEKQWATAGERSWQQQQSQIEYAVHSIYLKAKNKSHVRGTFSALHWELAMKFPLKITGLSTATFNTFSESSQCLALNLGFRNIPHPSFSSLPAH